jgi:hypothetical protein
MYIAWAILLQIAALVCSTVTLAGGSYAGVLTAALVFTLMAVALLILPFKRGGVATKIICIVLALPMVFVVLDFIRRAPHAF